IILYIYSFTSLYYCLLLFHLPLLSFFFFFNDTATSEIYTLSLHDALPIFSDTSRFLAKLVVATAGAKVPQVAGNNGLHGGRPDAEPFQVLRGADVVAGGGEVVVAAVWLPRQTLKDARLQPREAVAEADDAALVAGDLGGVFHPLAQGIGARTAQLVGAAVGVALVQAVDEGAGYVADVHRAEACIRRRQREEARG